ncbi:MAG: hypothetical protein JXD19_02825 [Deltaproteobacteria bacterium]|nr:hypothetical protein [Deltaproteobacteria bacterium]
MQIKRFEAQDMTRALRLIKQEFGSEAVILAARSVKKETGIFGFLKKPGVEVTAAVDLSCQTSEESTVSNGLWYGSGRGSTGSGIHDVTGASKVHQYVDNSPGPLHVQIQDLPGKRNPIPGDSDEIFSAYQRMLGHGVEEEIALALIREINNTASSPNARGEQNFRERFVGVVEDLGIVAFQKEKKWGKKRTIAFVGPTGVGKTTTVAKLAAVHSLAGEKSVAVIALDNYRIGAIQQLAIYARIIGVPIEVADSNKELKAALKKYRDKDLVLIDGVGINCRDSCQMSGLGDLFNDIPSLESNLVLSATTRENDLRHTIEAYREMAVTSMIFTKIDETASFGSILNRSYRTKLPVSYLTNGLRIPEDIVAASAERVVKLILDRRAEEKSDDSFGEALKGIVKKKMITTAGNSGAYVANKNSDIFHYRGCRWAKKIKPQNMVFFESRAEALSRNLKGCTVCNPHVNGVQRCDDGKGDKKRNAVHEG